MIILEKLKWSNCFSYGEGNEVDLSSNSLTQIIGLNGTGKSSIPLILEEILYNKNSKSIKKADIPNRYVGSEYYIELDFSIDSDKYKIKAERKKSLKIKISKNGTDISSHTATGTFKTIEEIIGLDFKTFSQLVYQNTNSSLQFLTATDTTRKKFLIDLLNLDEYVEYFDIFKDLVREFNSKVTEYEAKKNTIEKWLLENNLEGMEVLPLLNLEIDSVEEEKELGVLTENFENIRKINKKIEKNNLFKKQLKQIDIAKFSEYSGKEIESTDEHNKRLGSISSDNKRLKSAIEKLEKLSGCCPTCEQDIDEIIKTKILNQYINEREALVEEGRIVKATLEEIQESNKKIRIAKESQKEFESLYNSIDHDLQVDLMDADQLADDIYELECVIKEKQTRIKKLMTENNKREKNNTRYTVISEQIDDFSAQLDTILEELAEINSTNTNLEILKKAFSTNGLLAYKIENLVKELEDLVNQYLGELSDGRFTLEFSVVKDKLNVVITDNGKEIDILALSSGELARVNTATLLAIRKLMSSISKTQLNVLFLDEVINVLDETGKERLVDILVQEEKLNTFIVSHNWTHPLLAKLSVSKERNISKIEYGG